MILVEFQNTIFNFSNANVIDIHENTIFVYFNNKHVVEMTECDTSIDTSNFGDYFFKFETEQRKIYFSKNNFLYMQNAGMGIVRFLFFEDFKFDLMVDFDQLISQLEND